MGRYSEAVQSLQSAARFWSDPPTSPFADNYELVAALLSVGDIVEARQVARDALLRTRPWRRPYALAHFGLAAVHLVDGRLSDAIAAVEEAVREPQALGPGFLANISAFLVEALFLADESDSRIAEVYSRFAADPTDPRYDAELIPARAIAAHRKQECRGSCLDLIPDFENATRMGAADTVLVGEVKTGVLALAHGRRIMARRAWLAVAQAVDSGIALRLRPWLRLYAPKAVAALALPGGAALLGRLADADPEGWRVALLEALPQSNESDRPVLLAAITKHANRESIMALRDIGGRDVAEARRRLQHVRAARLYLRTFGGVSLHRGDWTGPALPIEKKRVRMLLAVLAARSHVALTRDMVIDTLWPTADADAAINNLNQTVFQLRRYIDSEYRGGESPEYVISSSDQVSLNPELIRTDLEEVMRLPQRLSGTDWGRQQATARRTISLIRGEFLADLRYEEWTAIQQITVHNEVRDRLLPIAQAPATQFEVDVSVQAASALIALDPYDEAAVLALADCLSRSGRRVAARDLVVDYARRLQAELEDGPSDDLAKAIQGFAAAATVNRDLTRAGR
jgi:DNA-binding SARP family transcriptional activator